jgi:hypothetical protein
MTKVQNSDVQLLARHAASNLPLDTARLGDEYFYQSLPLCVIDAVYSIGVRYDCVAAVVERYCRQFGLRKTRGDRKEMPPNNEQESVTEFCERLEPFTPEQLATEVFQNRQRTSARAGILKAEAVIRFAAVLKNAEVNFFRDIPKFLIRPEPMREIMNIPGQRSGISLKYFLMLAGNEGQIKPDRMVLRFLEDAIGRAVSISDAESLIAATSEKLSHQYPELTPRLLDHEIWRYQRTKKSS